MIAGSADRRILSIALAGVVLLAASACAGPSSTPASTGAAPVSEGGPDLTSVGFSTGGDKCELGESATTFAVGVPVRVVLTMEPALSTGGTVTVAMGKKDGAEMVERRETVTVAEPAPCIYGTLHDLEPGHYRVTYTITPSQMMPATGEFDVTP